MIKYGGCRDAESGAEGIQCNDQSPPAICTRSADDDHRSCIEGDNETVEAPVEQQACYTNVVAHYQSGGQRFIDVVVTQSQ